MPDTTCLFPDRDSCFKSVYAVLHCFQRVATVRRRNANDDTGLCYRNHTANTKNDQHAVSRFPDAVTFAMWVDWALSVPF